MLIIDNNITNPYFNIAAEEYLLKSFTDDCFMLYQNTPSIIVGKHQNTLAEINYHFIKQNNIDVIRRLSGGGTVFHDMGNINFMFIQNIKEGNALVNFRRFTDPIIEALNHLGVDAKFEGKNDIRVNGLKISGNAEHIFKRRVLHHGTLLFSSELNILNDAIKAEMNKYNDKGVKSIRSTVTNISDFLVEKISIPEFKNRVVKKIFEKNKNSTFYSFNPNDIKQVEKLVTEKYSTWDWNFGYSPNYDFENKIDTTNGSLSVNVTVEQGRIEKIKISGNFDSSEIENLLTGKKHNENEIHETLHKKVIQKDSFYNMDDIIKVLF
ncbi:MAG: lipoate--protein ligase [Bacteroidetes bacterium GWC2_33_15]|nr:MAG: lipoate--protein ligase [Bacteroidetes bacterium GWA2_33_15]OFX51372.1 MAG: lipoate--protein ligase [Bacteroidetes bacterium GWC2_33_15]OFX63156.1 MAG: lipoate--protein ligase [Bacteroidetes bacterium GWB2_32_14]OFX70748.1 MAG: lipoate--protein ligase [Bacteroidetes bacterium GWD2_33_33]HAN18453.1 lipoate--protein ligase [Bacteroidales bacterium]